MARVRRASLIPGYSAAPAADDIGVLPWSRDAVPAGARGPENGGAAIADVLFGDYNPAGRLPVTFYKSAHQLPPFTDYSMKGRIYRFSDGDRSIRSGMG
jgi:beta-glucosidase